MPTFKASNGQWLCVDESDQGNPWGPVVLANRDTDALSRGCYFDYMSPGISLRETFRPIPPSPLESGKPTQIYIQPLRRGILPHRIVAEKIPQGSPPLLRLRAPTVDRGVDTFHWGLFTIEKVDGGPNLWWQPRGASHRPRRHVRWRLCLRGRGRRRGVRP